MKQEKGKKKPVAALAAFADALLPELPQAAAAARAAGNEEEAVLYETKGSYSPSILSESFVEMSVERRQEVFRSWGSSKIILFPAVFRGIKSLIALSHLSTSPNTGENIFLKGLRYPSPSESRRVKPNPEAIENEEIVKSGLVSLKTVTADGNIDTVVQNECASRGIRIEKGHDQVTLLCDAVVLGSGAGGGTAAAVLAEAGMRVLILEKAEFVSISQMSLVEDEALSAMYEKGGLMQTIDGSITILAGSTLGGATRINWCASLRTPPHVLKEWSEAPHSLSDFSSEKYTSSMDAVCKRLSVNHNIEQNAHGGTLKAAFEQLGCHTAVMPTNCKSTTCSGMCCFGCKHGEKQDGVQTFLTDAVKAGARILTGCYAQKLIVEKNDEVGKPKKVKGVQCSVSTADGDRVQITIKAKIVICGCGALNTPALLLRSGITCSGNVGKNLRLHPGMGALGMFPNDPERKEGYIRMWEGAMMSFYSTEVANWKSKGAKYGPLLSVPPAHPGLLGSSLSWFDPWEYKKSIATIKNSICPLLYCRDQDSGEVTIDKDGQPVMHYWPSKRDRHNMMEGLILSLRALKAAGAEYIWTPNTSSQDSVGGFDATSPIDDDEFEEYIKGVREHGIQKLRMPVFSAHQLGTCRMGGSPSNSVADSTGETWEVKGLYICDSSALPSSSGVNPMITTQSISHMNSSGIVDRMPNNHRKHLDIEMDNKASGSSNRFVTGKGDEQEM